MPKSGPRPHTWKVQGEQNHDQYIAWMRMRAQAKYRGEQFELTFEQFQTKWADKWEHRGRGRDDYCLTRKDPEQSWNSNNCELRIRAEHLAESNRRTRNGNNRNKVYS